MAVLSCTSLHLPKHGACSTTPGRVREVRVPASCHAVFIEQAGAVSGTLYVTSASGYTDEAASPTLVAASDAITILTSGSFTLILPVRADATDGTRSIFIGSDTNGTTFKVQPLGIEVRS